MSQVFDRLGDYAWWVDSLVGVGAVLVLVTLLAVIGYLLQFWGFRLTRHSGGTLHITRGLLTSRESSIEEKRIRGLEVGEPLGLRPGGGRAAARHHDRAQQAGGPARHRLAGAAGSRRVVEEVRHAVVGDLEALERPLTQHGPAARRRRYVRALVPLLVILLAALVMTLWRQWPIGSRRRRSSGPGHAVDRAGPLRRPRPPPHPEPPGGRSGSFVRRRDIVQRTGVIGWNVRSSWFQRRVGLAHVTATTAAGKQGYTAYDIPVGAGVALAHEVDPDLIRQFLA